jgi:hypothetical protein
VALYGGTCVLPSPSNDSFDSLVHCCRAATPPAVLKAAGRLSSRRRDQHAKSRVCSSVVEAATATRGACSASR